MPEKKLDCVFKASRKTWSLKYHSDPLMSQVFNCACIALHCACGCLHWPGTAEAVTLRSQPLGSEKTEFKELLDKVGEIARQALRKGT